MIERWKQNIYGQPRLSSKQEKVRGVASGIMFSAVIHMHQRGYIRLPISLLIRFQGTQHLKQSAVEPLTLTISHRMIWCGPALLYPTQNTQLLGHTALKIPALMAVEASRKTIIYKKLSYKIWAVVFAVWYLVGHACEYFMKWSVTTRMFSNPPFEVSRVK